MCVDEDNLCAACVLSLCWCPKRTGLLSPSCGSWRDLIFLSCWNMQDESALRPEGGQGWTGVGEYKQGTRGRAVHVAGLREAHVALALADVTDSFSPRYRQTPDEAGAGHVQFLPSRDGCQDFPLCLPTYKATDLPAILGPNTDPSRNRAAKPQLTSQPTPQPSAGLGHLLQSHRGGLPRGAAHY